MPVTLVAPLLAMQIAAFGWRINREIVVGDQERRAWLPLPDVINILSLLIVTGLCVVVPLASSEFNRSAKTALAVGYTLMAFHPISVACHYRLFSRSGRTVYSKAGLDYPPITDHEVASVVISLAVALVVGRYVWLAAG
jgi:hypothetical protein